MSNTINIEELWDNILEEEHKQVRLPSIAYVPVLKRMLGKYKYLQLRQNPHIVDLLGEFKLAYEIEKVTDSMSVILHIKRVINEPNKLEVPGDILE